MPLLNILTNVPKSKIPIDFLERIIPIIASTIGKPAEKCACAITGDVGVCFGSDSKTPGAVATLVSIGHLGPQQNVHISETLADYLQKEIGVPPRRFFISFHDQEPFNIGIAGTTVQDRNEKN